MASGWCKCHINVILGVVESECRLMEFGTEMNFSCDADQSKRRFDAQP